MLRKLGNIKPIKQERQGRAVPHGQYVTEKFPVLSYGSTPRIDLKTWRLRFYGLVEQEVIFNWEGFLSLPQAALTRDFHCVTQWSRLDNEWEGVQFREVMQHVALKPGASHVLVHCYGGYTTNLPLDVLMEEDVLFAHKHDGKPLEPDHGGPLRLVVPSRYGWKSAKWVSDLEFLDHDEPGFWERMGYHMNGDPWKEERFGFPGR